MRPHLKKLGNHEDMDQAFKITCHANVTWKIDMCLKCIEKCCKDFEISEIKTYASSLFLDWKLVIIKKLLIALIWMKTWYSNTTLQDCTIYLNFGTLALIFFTNQNIITILLLYQSTFIRIK